MKNVDYILNNMQKILDAANSELKHYGVRLDTIMLTNCEGDTFDAKFIFSAQSNPSYETKQSAERIACSVLKDFIRRYIPSTYIMRRSDCVYYF